MGEQYDIFISYRSDGGESAAKILHDKLADAGYKVFIDIDSLRSGDFDTALYTAIEECKDFLLILSPDALEQCEDENDWVRLEVEHALKHGINIIPIMLKGFSFPDKLPPSIAAVRYKHGLESNYQFFDAFITKLQTFLITKRPKKKSHFLLAAGAAAVLLCIVLSIWLTSRHKDVTLFETTEYYAENKELPSLNTCTDGVTYFGKNGAGYLYSVDGGRKETIDVLARYSDILQGLGFEVKKFEDSKSVRFFSCTNSTYRIIRDKAEEAVYKDSEIVALIGDVTESENPDDCQIYVMTNPEAENYFYGKMMYLNDIAEQFPDPETCDLEIVLSEEREDYYIYTLSEGDKTLTNNRVSCYMLVLKNFGFTVEDNEEANDKKDGYKYYKVCNQSGFVTHIAVYEDTGKLWIQKTAQTQDN